MTECSYVSNSLLNTCVKSLRLQAKVPQPNGMPAKCLHVAIPAESKKEAGEEEKPSMGSPNHGNVATYCRGCTWLMVVLHSLPSSKTLMQAQPAQGSSG